MLLNVHSYYSLRYGTNSVDELVDMLVKGGYDTAVLTDINNSTGVLEFIKVCREKGVRGLAGMEYRNGDSLLYIGIAKDEEGFRELNELMTASNLEKTPLPFPAPELQHCFIVYPFDAILARDLLPHEFIGVQAHQLNHVWKRGKDYQARCVILKPVSFKNNAGYTLHRQLRAIDHNLLLSQLKVTQYAPTSEVFCTHRRLLDRFRDFPQIIKNTEDLLAECSFSFDFKTTKN